MCEEYNIRVNPKKCEFFRDKTEFCGHTVDKEGLHKTEEKIKAIVDAPEITNVSQLRSFLGLVQYYARFFEELVYHSTSSPSAIEKEWKWTAKCQAAVNKVKSMITSDLALMNYDPAFSLILACDASVYGLGAVLSHKLPDGSERPIAFPSRTLNSAEVNDSQIDMEATSIVWGVKKFNTYLYGNEFTLITDHKPLISIFSPKKALSATTGTRLQRYALFLSGYVYNIQYKKTKAHGNCDSLSQIPLPEIEVHMVDFMDLYLNSLMNNLPVTSSQIANETRNDPILSQVYEIIFNRHFPSYSATTELKPFLSRNKELRLHQGCIMWGTRVIVPDVLWKQVLQELHQGHVSIVKMISLARSYVWWPNIDSELETVAMSCMGCMENK